MTMSDQTNPVLKAIQARLAEKDEIIREQMIQITEYEDKIAGLEAKVNELQAAKKDYDEMKAQLAALLGN